MLKSRSRDINRIQKIIDPLVILIFFKIFIEDKFQDFSIFYIGLFIINLSILKYYKIYESFREKNLINLIPKILFICCATTFLSLLITKIDLPIETFKIIEMPMEEKE